MTATLPTLRPYQTTMLTAIDAALQGGQRRVLCKAPTGTGKTVTFAALWQHAPLVAWLRTLGLRQPRMLVIAHREELLDQAADKISTQNPGAIVCIEQGDRVANKYADVIIASIQTLAARKFKRLKRLLEPGHFPLVVIDEAHHAAAPTYRTALVHLGFLPAADASETEDVEAIDHDDVELMKQALDGWDLVAPTDRLLIGVTATPNRSDAIGLSCVFQTLAYSYDLKTAIGDQYLVPIRGLSVGSKDSLDKVRTTAGDWNQKDLAGVVNNPARNRLAVEAWKAHAPGRPTLAFTVDVQHAHDLAAAFTTGGVRAQALSGETPKDDRRAMLAAYTAGDLDLIANCMVLTEGTDLPRTSCILHAKPTQSATLYEQMTGRGLRLFPGKTDCLVLDIVDVSRKHSLQQAGVLFGLPPGLMARDQDVAQLEKELDEFREKYPQFDVEEALEGRLLTIQQLLALAQQVDVWNVLPLGVFGEGRELTWLRVGPETFRLSYPWADGDETVDVSKDLLGAWQVVLTLRPRIEPGRVPTPARQRTIASQIPNELTAGTVAEAFVRQQRPSILKLKGKNAPWMARPASPGQLDYLRRLRVPFAPKITMGEASTLIDLAKSRKGR